MICYLAILSSIDNRRVTADLDIDIFFTFNVCDNNILALYSFFIMADDDSRRHSSSVDSPSTVVTTPDADVDDDDVWASDNDQHHDQTNSCDTRENLLSDLPIVRRHHMTDGYREGLSVGKAKVMQKGFDVGYPIGVSIALRVGKILGCFEGILASKDVSDEVKASVKVFFTQAKQELSVTTFLKDMSDQEIMQFDGIPDHVQVAVVKWEKKIFGSSD